MGNITHEKKIYLILFLIYIGTDFLLTLVCTIVSNSLLRSAYMINGIVSILSIISVGVLIFASLRYKFRLCLPFIAVSIISSIFTYYVIPMLSLSLNTRQLQHLYTLGGTFLFAVSCAIPFICFGAVKVVSKLIKNKTAVVVTILIAFLIINYLVLIITPIFNNYFIYKTVQMNIMPNYIFMNMPIMLMYSLKNSIILAVTYIILHFLFGKQANVPENPLCAKNDIKNL